MGLFSKLLGKGSAPPPAPPQAQPPAPKPAPVEPTDVERLGAVALPGGPPLDEALALFKRLRTTSDEGAAVEALAHAQADRGLPEPLLVAAASAMADRGDPARAFDVLQNATSPAALLLRADLAADHGDVPRALSLVERVLLREIDHPGALERHRRYRAALGLVEGRRPDLATSTVVAAEPDTPYQLLREVARGGAGAVYEAEDRDLGRRVALKVYHEPTRDRDQLLHEVRVAAELSGPGVVRIFDVDPEHGWIALEWAPLGALRERLRSGDLRSLLPVERWALPLARALSRVHDAGFVHLDVKPANVLLLAPDNPVLADFGLARRLGTPSPPGSMGYVSPERLAKQPADFKDDVFGFGRILEDVLDAAALAASDKPAADAAGAGFRSLAQLCTGPAAARPAHARDLVVRIQALRECS
ncbi:MAG TPA: serine/threonine-protein kinase [Polyangiaceae bacterium]|nr:serine/threonine-protein kinase [Polyangiaceae bacterium]